MSTTSVLTQTSESYLAEIKSLLQIEWPHNRAINLVFHGHSVPAGYFKTPHVNTLAAYPMLVLKSLKDKYPNAVINVINTSIGGENSVKGSARFASEVLPHAPDVIFIDYALNDRRIGLEASRDAWKKMIEDALRKEIKVILLTPSPDLKEDPIEDSPLTLHTKQIQNLAKSYKIGLVDSYQQFANQVANGEQLVDFMSQSNHPNERGHLLIAQQIMTYF